MMVSIEDTKRYKEAENINVFNKAIMLITMGFLAFLLVSCGSEIGKAGDSDSLDEGIESAISSVPGVAEVEARYNVNVGMGSTLSIRIQAETDEVTLEDVMTESLVALSDAVSDSTMNPRMGISFQVTEMGQENTINPTSIGLPQRPNILEINDFINNAK